MAAQAAQVTMMAVDDVQGASPAHSVASNTSNASNHPVLQIDVDSMIGGSVSWSRGVAQCADHLFSLALRLSVLHFNSSILDCYWKLHWIFARWNDDWTVVVAWNDPRERGYAPRPCRLALGLVLAWHALRSLATLCSRSLSSLDAPPAHPALHPLPQPCLSPCALYSHFLTLHSTRFLRIMNDIRLSGRCVAHLTNDLTRGPLSNPISQCRRYSCCALIASLLASSPSLSAHARFPRFPLIPRLLPHLSLALLARSRTFA